QPAPQPACSTTGPGRARAPTPCPAPSGAESFHAVCVSSSNACIAGCVFCSEDACADATHVSVTSIDGPLVGADATGVADDALADGADEASPDFLLHARPRTTNGATSQSLLVMD